MTDISKFKEKLERQIRYLKEKNAGTIKFNQFHSCLSYVQFVLTVINKNEKGNLKFVKCWMRLCNEAIHETNKHI